METIGLIAGRGNFPVLFAKEAKDRGYNVIAVAVKGNTRKCLKEYVQKMFWVDVREFRRIFEIFREEEVHRAAMAGQINPYLLFEPKVMSEPDVRIFFGSIKDRRADTIFTAFAERLQEQGIELIASTSFLDSYMPKGAVLTKRQPTESEDKDIGLGFRVAKHLGSIDIGQSVCLKDGVVLAIEAIEGTDNAIRRAVSLAKSAIVLVKVSKPAQDARFDVPVVGYKTIKNLPKGSCLAFEAAKTLFFDQAPAIELADRKDISISACNFP